ncbi:MAG: septum formation protein Maf, partial [Bdellovibrionales bacterium]|nr:septum formation protein Maf [Bdellovibrionales bacterium]
EKSLVLASGSPRRKELLAGLGVEFQVIVSDFDEDAITAPAEKLAEILATEKAKVVSEGNRAEWVLAGDTVVLIDGELLGKPASEDEARYMIRRLAGRVHRVIGGYSIQCREADYSESFSVATDVEFVGLDEETIRRYVSTGESFDKAGGYAIQGIGQSLVKRINGSYTNVIGLDVPTVSSLLFEIGVIRLRGVS